MKSGEPGDDSRFNTFVNVNSQFEAKTATENDPGVSLTDYMRLPVDQYVCIRMPLDSQLDRLDGNNFLLTVPPVTFFNLEVSPNVYCIVTQDDKSVIIESDNVVLKGSPYVEKLNGCYQIKIKTVFNWKDTDNEKAILSKSTIQAKVDPPKPFKYFGKRVLETTGTLAMSIALRQIENAFVSNLCKDYEKWALSADYRELRKQGTCDLDFGGEGELDKHQVASVQTSNAPDTKIDTKTSSNESDKNNDSDSNATMTSSSDSSSETKEKEEKRLEIEEVSDGSTISSSNEMVSDEKKMLLYSTTGSSADPATVSDDDKAMPLKNIPIRAENIDDPSVASNVEIPPKEATLNNMKNQFQIYLEMNGKEERDEGPAVLRDDVCLVRGDPVVRIEEAPENSRRIFTGIDISADIEDVWSVLTDYGNLQNVIPNLVANKVRESRDDGGAILEQVGGAKVLPGVTFKAKTVLDVCTYKEGNPIPDEWTADHLPDAPGIGAGDAEVRAYDKRLPLQRGIFPRPYAITQLPHRDITMQNLLGEGDFDHYQGIWRLQKLPNCAPDGGDACRLTYAVELRPRGILPVKLIEGRIASDLRSNLLAIQNYVEAQVEDREGEEERREMELSTPAVALTVNESPSLESSAAGMPKSVSVELGSVLSALKLMKIKTMLEQYQDVAVLEAKAREKRVNKRGELALDVQRGKVFNDELKEIMSKDDNKDDISLGDTISPKEYSYRRLLVTGSGYTRPSAIQERLEKLYMAEQIKELQKELEASKELLEDIFEVSSSLKVAEVNDATADGQE